MPVSLDVPTLVSPGASSAASRALSSAPHGFYSPGLQRSRSRSGSDVSTESALRAFLHANAGETGQTSSAAMCANFVTAGLGAGILSLPWTTAGASILSGIAITGVVLAFNAWTCLILVQAADRLNSFDLGDLLGFLPGRIGPIAQVLSNVFLWISLFMCLVGYVIVMADAVVPFMGGGALSNHSLWLVLSSVMVLPVCYLDQGYLGFTSSLAILVNVLLFALVGYYAVTEPYIGSPPVCGLAATIGSISMFSAVVQAIALQTVVLPMYQTLERRSYARFRRVVISSFTFLFVLFAGFQSLAVIAFGPQVSSNVLQDLPHNLAGNFARAGMFLVILGVYPVMVIPMVAPIKNSRRGGPVAAAIATAVIVIAAMIVSFFANSLGLMNVLNGALSVVVFCAGIPALIGLYVVRYHRVVMVALFLLGLLMACLGFVMTDNYVKLLDTQCLLAFQLR